MSDPLSAVGYRLSASGCRRAFGNPPLATAWPSPAPVGSVLLDSQSSIDSANPVSLPPDKQWGAREYIGARHPPLSRGGQGM